MTSNFYKVLHFNALDKKLYSAIVSNYKNYSIVYTPNEWIRSIPNTLGIFIFSDSQSANDFRLDNCFTNGQIWSCEAKKVKKLDYRFDVSSINHFDSAIELFLKFKKQKKSMNQMPNFFSKYYRSSYIRAVPVNTYVASSIKLIEKV
jgi:hypothetical protein